MKTIFGILAAAFLLLGAYNVAKACDNPLSDLTDRVENLQKADPKRDIKAFKIDEAQKAKLNEALPIPAEPPYDVTVIEVDDNAIIAVSKDGCLVATSGVLPRQPLENIIGIAHAEAQ